MKATISALAFLVFIVSASVFAKPPADEAPVNSKFRASQNAVILIIRHAEKPDAGPDLSPAGRERAAAYPAYFKTFMVGPKPLQLDAIYATADSKESHRPRLTVEPLSRALGLKIHDRFKDKDFAQLAADISAKSEKNILICWHHGETPGLLGALGAEPVALLPKGKWPAAEFGWVLELHYDGEGRLIPGETRRVEVNLKLSAR
jgi:hypothetical protein